MSVISMPERSVPEIDLEDITELAVTLSRRLTRTMPDDLPAVIGEVLEQVASGTHVDTCQFLEFNESGGQPQVFLPRGTVSSCSPSGPEPWLIARLARGESCAISRPDELPPDAGVRRTQARRVGACSILGVPASAGGRVVGGW